MIKKIAAASFFSLFVLFANVSIAESVDHNTPIELEKEKCKKCGDKKCKGSCDSKKESKATSKEVKKSCCSKSEGAKACSSKKKEEK